MCPERRSASGLSLIELVIFIIVLTIGLTGLMVLYNQTTKSSIDPVVRKQVLAIAASVLEEIELRGFTYCDPDDANVYSASSSAGCATIAESPTMGPDAGEATRTAFDNVNDYNGFQMMSGITDISGATIAGLGGYQVTGVTVAPAGTAFSLADNQDALSITVTVTGPAGVSVSLKGYRFRYAPNSP